MLSRLLDIFRRNPVVGWCVTCKGNVRRNERSFAIDGSDVRVHERCTYVAARGRRG